MQISCWRAVILHKIPKLGCFSVWCIPAQILYTNILKLHTWIWPRRPSRTLHAICIVYISFHIHISSLSSLSFVTFSSLLVLYSRDLWKSIFRWVIKHVCTYVCVRYIKANEQWTQWFNMAPVFNNQRSMVLMKLHFRKIKITQ